MDPVTAGLQFGRYVIRGKLGAGGMGDVFLADDTQLGRRVALKFLKPETETDPHAQRRLLREARAAATLDHPHICSVYEVGEPAGSTSRCNTSRARRSTHGCAGLHSISTRFWRAPCRSSMPSARPTPRASFIATSSPPTSSSRRAATPR